MANKPIVLFDMDGTLTHPRQKAESEIIHSLVELSKYSDIGILTGSDIEYVMQQLPQIDDLANLVEGTIDILPCNGTKRYVFIKNKGFEQRVSVSMLGSIGRKSYNEILTKCCEWQHEIMSEYPDLPYTGTFMQYRGSLLNWCPIGRAAGLTQRKEWESLDQEKKIREKYQKLLSEWTEKSGITVTTALGGSTSFDIYPNGWDKTYGLSYYLDREVYFVGDKCKKGGNDWHIYEKLKPLGRSYETTDPARTSELIVDIISELSKS